MYVKIIKKRVIVDLEILVNFYMIDRIILLDGKWKLLIFPILLRGIWELLKKMQVTRKRIKYLLLV